MSRRRRLVYALAENGYVRWRVDLGQLERVCQQIDGYGVTGTPVIDLATHALYVADAFGRVHALDLATGAEHARLAGRPSTATSGVSSSGARSRWSTARSTSGPARTATARWSARCSASSLRRAPSRAGWPCRAGSAAAGASGAGAARVQRDARLALRGDRATRSRAARTAASASASTRLRRADRRAHPRPARPRLEPSARIHQKTGPRLRRLARSLPARGLRRSASRLNKTGSCTCGASSGLPRAALAPALEPDARGTAAHPGARIRRAPGRCTCPPRAGSSASTSTADAAGGSVGAQGRERALQRLAHDRGRHRVARGERVRGLGASSACGRGRGRDVQGELGGAAYAAPTVVVTASTSRRTTAACRLRARVGAEKRPGRGGQRAPRVPSSSDGSIAGSAARTASTRPTTEEARGGRFTPEARSGSHRSRRRAE